MWWQTDPKAEALYSLSPYNSMGNNPILYNDPNGDFIHIVIGGAIGGVGNLIYQAATGNIQSIGDGFAAFGIGAVAGGVGAATGGLSLAATGAGTTLAGAVGAGALSGAVGGAAGGLIQGTGNAMYFQNQGFGEAIGGAGLQGAMWGAIGGAVIGGTVAGFRFNKPAAPTSSLGDEATEPIRKFPTTENSGQYGSGGGEVVRQGGANATTGTAFTAGLDDAVSVTAQSGSRLGLPRGVVASWGKFFNYRHGGNMSAIEHIFYRHSYNTGFNNVSRFAQNTTVKAVKQYVDQAVKYGRPVNGGFEYNIGRTIGTGSNGLPASTIKVFVRDGWVRSAFPVN